jgi:hypothetical protein
MKDDSEIKQIFVTSFRDTKLNFLNMLSNVSEVVNQKERVEANTHVNWIPESKSKMIEIDKRGSYLLTFIDSCIRNWNRVIFLNDSSVSVGILKCFLLLVNSLIENEKKLNEIIFMKI